MKQRIKRKLRTLAEVVALFVPRYLVGVAFESEVVNLIVEANRGNRRRLQRLTQLLHLRR